MRTLMRVLFFWIKVVGVLLIVCVLAGSSFFVAMDIVNLDILIKDGMSKRIDVLMDPVDNDPGELKKFFTQEYLAADSELNGAPYSEYEIESYEYDTKIDRIWCWPWQNSVTAVISCRMLKLTGSKLEQYMTAEQVEADEHISPPEYENVRYKITCERIDNKWIITGLEFVENFTVKDKEPDETAKPTESPEPDVTPSESPAAE